MDSEAPEGEGLYRLTTIMEEPSISNETKNKFRKSVYVYESYIQSMNKGQMAQANILRDDFRKNMDSLFTEMMKHRALQKQMMEMQQVIFGMQQQALDRFALIKSRIQAILVQNLEWHECPIPRLFIVLPAEGAAGGSDGGRSGGSSDPDFRVYFLCECGEHTQTSDSKLSHHIHATEHFGYRIESHTDFFRHYGSYVLSMLQMLKYGVSVKGLSVPSLLSKAKLDASAEDSDIFDHSHLADRINTAIDYLQFLSKNGHLGPSTGYNQRVDESQLIDSSDLYYIKSLIKIRDQSETLGNLYRMPTKDGYVKWVCPDHYNEAYNMSAMKDLSEVLSDNRASLDVNIGRIDITLHSKEAASHFYRVMERASFVQELKIKLTWEVCTDDLKQLHSVICRSHIVNLILTCTPTSSTSVFSKNSKKSEWLWQTVIDAKLQSFTLNEYSGFFSKAPTPLKQNNLTILKDYEILDWGKEANKLKLTEALRQSPRLRDLHLGCVNIDDAYDTIRRTTTGFSILEHLVLDGGINNGMQARFKRGEPVWMNLVTSDLGSTVLEYAQGLKNLHLRPQGATQVEPSFLEKVITNNLDLVKLWVMCPVSEFQTLYMVVKETVSMNVSSKLNDVKLFSLKNQLAATNLQNGGEVSLELMSCTFSWDTHESLFRVYGSRLTKLRIEGDTIKNLSALNLTLKREGTSLQHLEIASTLITPFMFRDLKLLLHSCCTTLSNLSITIYEPWADTKYQNDLVNFIVEFKEIWTSIIVGSLEAGKWIEVFGVRGYRMKDQVITLAPSFSKRIEKMEGHYGTVPYSHNVSRMSTAKKNEMKKIAY
ncbi:hypothetical protein BGZ76_000403 [Entomortierella beljakovae]|nr:hypothetical protein BGZ76_000403 [Entomortierella beljakovae]